ncbi:MAG TPA: helix-turn-helix transcriptional regulator [Gaiellaceae bacterium]|nr:helix-turn-helix transcriptional regulator [Gaiellaceae bacterium]
MATPETVTEPAAFTGLAQRNGNELRRSELGAFLRSRRERIGPEQVGLRPLRRRRTPGLRREEVAQLAGVGVTWYTWLEQGRDIHPSAQVLDAISRTLQFDAHEHSHLFTLAGVATTTIANECLALCPTVQPLIDQLEPFPASAVNSRLDLLAYNRVYASFFDDIDTIPIEDRNILWLAFTHPQWRAAIVDWDEVAGRMVAEYRAAMAEHLDDPAWKTLVARLHRASPEFTAVWERHDVQGVESRTKRAMHPTVGLLSLDYTNLWVGQQVGTRIIAFTPADERTRQRLETLHESLTQDVPDAAVARAG